MFEKFKPMLAETCSDLSQVKFPVLASPKLDGIRCTIFSGVAYSRSKKPIPNKFVQEWVKLHAEILEGFDGELIVGSPTDELVFSNTTSFVMSHDKVQEFGFYAFDLVNADNAETRQNRLYSIISGAAIPRVHLVYQELVETSDQLQEFEEKQLLLGYEGTMLKNPEGLYKFGRSTLKSGQLLKRKTFVDSEFVVVGCEPLWHNTNESKTNELGRTERSTSKEGLVALETLGSLTCALPDGKVFSVGTGFDTELRKSLWGSKDQMIGKLAKVKYFPIGMQDGVPRFPVFVGFRSEDDL